MMFFLVTQNHAFESFKLNEQEHQTQSSLKGIDISEESPLYQEITNYLDLHSDEIARRELDLVDQGRNLSIVGGMNHVGINFTKGFGTFSIELKREVAPDLFHDERWLVTDTFNIYIDASQVLSKLADDEIIDISDKNLAAFAGVTFKRAYTHVHFADTYERALGFNLDKLFFSFRQFQNLEALKIAPQEFIKKEDSISLQAGGIGTAPLTTGLGAHVGALVKFQKIEVITLLGVSEEEASYPGERVRISVEKEKSHFLGAHAGLVADFMGVLQITLLRFDFSYELSEVFRTYLSFDEEQVENMTSYEGLESELRKIFKGQGFNREIVAPFLVSEEQRKKENKKLQYGILLFAGSKATQTEHIQITNKGVVTSFFRHNYEKIRYFENIFSRLFKIVVKSFLKANTVVNKAVSESENVRLEYRSKKNLIQTRDDLVFEDESETLSLNFQRDFYAYKLKKLSTAHLVKLMDRYSGIDPAVINHIENGLLKESVEFSSLYSIGHEGMAHLHNLNTSAIYDIFDRACESTRSGIKGWLSRLFKRCEKSLKRSYDEYRIEWATEDYQKTTYKSCEASYKQYRKKKLFVSSRRKRLFLESCMQRISKKSPEARNKELPLWQLARLSDKLKKEIPHKNFYFQLFGYSNVHVHGEISGVDGNGQLFQNYFREGIFKGLGVVSNYKKNNGLRSPASVNSY